MRVCPSVQRIKMNETDIGDDLFPGGDASAPNQVDPMTWMTVAVDKRQFERTAGTETNPLDVTGLTGWHRETVAQADKVHAAEMKLARKNAHRLKHWTGGRL